MLVILTNRHKFMINNGAQFSDGEAKNLMCTKIMFDYSIL